MGLMFNLGAQALLSAFYFCSSVSSQQSKGQVMHSNT